MWELSRQSIETAHRVQPTRYGLVKISVKTALNYVYTEGSSFESIQYQDGGTSHFLGSKNAHGSWGSDSSSIKTPSQFSGRSSTMSWNSILPSFFLLFTVTDCLSASVHLLYGKVVTWHNAIWLPNLSYPQQCCLHPVPLLQQPPLSSLAKKLNHLGFHHKVDQPHGADKWLEQAGERYTWAWIRWWGEVLQRGGGEEDEGCGEEHQQTL